LGWLLSGGWWLDGWQADGGWQRLAVNAGKSAWQNAVSCWLAKAAGWRWLAGGLWLANAGGWRWLSRQMLAKGWLVGLVGKGW
jgi:hypothetical protein